MCELSLLFGHKLSHLKFEIHVVMHLSQRRLQTRCQNTNWSSQMRWLLKGMAGGTLIGLLRVTPKTHLRVSDQPILDKAHLTCNNNAKLIYLAVIIATAP